MDNVTKIVKEAAKAINNVDVSIEQPPHDFLIKVIGEICTLRIHGDERRISGKVEEVGPEFVLLRHRDRRVSLLKISAIDLISVVPGREV